MGSNFEITKIIILPELEKRETTIQLLNAVKPW